MHRRIVAVKIAPTGFMLNNYFLSFTIFLHQKSPAGRRVHHKTPFALFELFILSLSASLTT